MQKHLSEHVRDLMRKARESAGFRFTATPVASKTKKIPAAVKEATRVSPVRKPKEKTMKIKLQPPSKKSAPPPPPTVVKQLKKTSPRKGIKEEPQSPTKREGKRKRRSATVVEDENIELMTGIADVVEEVTVKEKWLKLYHDKYRAVDEARFRAIQVFLLKIYFDLNLKLIFWLKF